MTDAADDRPGWGAWDYVSEEHTGSLDDPVEAAMEGTNFGVRGRGDEWRVFEVTEHHNIVVDETVWPLALDAMREVERRVSLR